MRAGDVDRALAEVEAYAPGALEAHPRLLFRLRCQKFIELVRQPRHAKRHVGAGSKPRPQIVAIVAMFDVYT